MTTKYRRPLMFQEHDDQTAEYVRQLVRSAYGAPHSRHIPVDNPVSLDRTNIGQLSREPYAVAFKADGVRYVLVLTMYLNRPLACLVNRNGDVYRLFIIADESHFHQGTVLDGELCRVRTGEDTHDFLVFNCLVYQGVNVARENYAVRYQKVEQCISPEPLSQANRRRHEDLIIAADPRIHVVMKKVDDAASLRSLIFHYQPRYPTDGYIFTALNNGVSPGRDESLLKCKPNHPIDVMCIADTDAWIHALEVDNGGRPEELATALGMPVQLNPQDPSFAPVLRGGMVFHRLCYGPDSHRAPFQEVIEVDCRLVNDSVGEGRHVSLRFLRLRPDKEGPNNRVTVKRTLNTIMHNITMDDVLEAVATQAAAKAPATGAPLRNPLS